VPAKTLMRAGIAAWAVTIVAVAATSAAMGQGPSVFQATLGEANAKTPEVGTEELRRILADGSAVVLYCNGQFCQASRRLSEHLLAAGFTNVRRYQLGIPIWRALNGPVEIELEGILRIFNVDGTAVFFDGRDAEEFSRGSLSGAHNVPIDKLGNGALEIAPLPRDDFNTRVILFGRDGAQARRLADLIGKTPYQNVSYYPGAFETLAAAIRSK